MFDVGTLQVDFQREEEREQKFVILVQATTRVTKHLIRQVFNDDKDSLGRHRRLLRSENADSKNLHQ